MAKQSPFIDAQFPSIQGGIGIEYAPFNPTAGSGLDGLLKGSANRAMMGDELVRASQFAMPEMRRPTAATAKAYYSPSLDKYNVAGQEYTSDDDAAALELSQYAGMGQAPQGGDWVPLDDTTYSAYIESIRNPSLGTLAKKNFGIGVDNLQMLAGRGLQFLGAEETGQAIVDQQMQDLGKTSPYQRQFTDIDSPGGVVDWFVANLAQQGPNLIESVLTAGAGAIAGGLAGGGPNPLTAIGGAVLALGGKTAAKQAALAAAKKYSEGKALDAAEQKLLTEFARGAAASTDLAAPLRRAGLNQARIGGAAGLSLASNYGQGVSELYGESIEGGDPNRLGAAALGVPFALADTAAEALLGARVLGGAGGALTRGSTASRFGKGLGVGAVTEGGTEAFQEGLLLGINPMVSATDPEGINRLINSFAAGAAIGGPLGGAANALARPSITPSQKINLDSGGPTNLLGPKTPEPPVSPPSAPQLGFDSSVTPVEFAGRTGPTPIFDQIGQSPLGIGQATPTVDQQDQSAELSALGAPAPRLPAPPPAQPPAAPPVQQAGQNVAPPNTVLGDKLKAQIRARQEEAARQQMLQQQAQQPAAVIPMGMSPEIAAAQREAQLNRLQALGQAQRQLDIARSAEDAQRPVMFDDMRGEQAQIFTQEEAPRPPKSKGDKLKKGNPFVEAVEAVATNVRGGKQLDLITAKGEPTVAAMKGVGVKNKATRQDGDEIQPVEPKRKTELKRGKAKEKESAVQEPSPAAVPARVEAKPSQQVGEEVPSGKAVTKESKAEEKVGPIVTKAAAAQRERKAKSTWEEMRHPDSPKWKDLEESKREVWRTAVDEDKATMALAEEVAPPPKKGEPELKKAEAGQPAQPQSAKASEAKPKKIKVVDADGREAEMEVADVEAMKAKIDSDIARFQGLLNCLKAK